MSSRMTPAEAAVIELARAYLNHEGEWKMALIELSNNLALINHPQSKKFAKCVYHCLHCSLSERINWIESLVTALQQNPYATI